MPRSENVQAIELIDESREFAVEELFFSTTDPDSRIQRSNGVFQRISGYSWEALKNQPHNVIRHPDMPRVIFQLFWKYLRSGQPIVAYVKNLAHDGRYYWVVALVVPIQDGYLSIRFKPTSPLFATVRELYSELKAIEASIENDSKDKQAAMNASGQVLKTRLETLGFSSYDGFMREALKLEMQSREAALPDIAAQISGPLSRTLAGEAPELVSLGFAARTFD